ncbi:MAG: anti-sigma factor [Thermoleophilaceae bacterium]
MSIERHEIYEQDSGAYVLGALSEEEQTRFVRHLLECHLCQDDVDRLQRAVDVLPRSVTPVSAPPSLRAAVMDVVRSDLDEAADRPGLLARLRGRFARAGRLRLRAISISAAAILFVGLLGGFGLSRVVDHNGRGERVLTAQFDKSRMASGSGNLVVAGKSADAGGTLRVHGMASLPGDETYQVWLQRNGETIPKALFNVGQDGNGLTAVDGKLDDADAVVVTREAAGGARSPTRKPVLTVKL